MQVYNSTCSLQYETNPFPGCSLCPQLLLQLLQASLKIDNASFLTFITYLTSLYAQGSICRGGCGGSTPTVGVGDPHS